MNRIYIYIYTQNEFHSYLQAGLTLTRQSHWSHLVRVSTTRENHTDNQILLIQTIHQ